MQMDAPMAMESDTYSSEPHAMHHEPMASPFASEPDISTASEAPREEYFGEREEMQPTAEEIPPAAEEMPASEPPAPTFGRSKRRVPRR